MPADPPSQPTPGDAEAVVRRLAAEAGLRPPDRVEPRESGGITCIWWEEKLAVVVEPDELPG